jgi:hypothetical protein
MTIKQSKFPFAFDEVKLTSEKIASPLLPAFFLFTETCSLVDESGRVERLEAVRGQQRRCLLSIVVLVECRVCFTSHPVFYIKVDVGRWK